MTFGGAGAGRRWLEERGLRHRSGLVSLTACALALTTCLGADAGGDSPDAGKRPEPDLVSSDARLDAVPADDWLVVTGDSQARRYSSLDQIDADNVEDLERVWRWVSPDQAVIARNRRLQDPRMRLGPHQVTAVELGDRLYVTTGLGQVAAIDGATGATLWVHDPRVYEAGRPLGSGFVHRGVAWWPGDAATPSRLFYAAGDSMLRAVDPRDGAPVRSFGDDGAVDLTRGLRRPVSRRSYSVKSPVSVCRDVVVVGSSLSDTHLRRQSPPGDVRGFDARTGRLRWTFHSIPQPGEVGHETWEEGSWETTGDANVWTLMSADEQLGLVYLPFGTPTNDWYGGHRPGDGLFGESLVAVDCETGERRWHFQAVHHGLWDYDLVTAAVLADLQIDGRAVRAALQVSKQGFVYALDRVAGEPIWPVEERVVPPSEAPGEQASPTQPFPTRPPPYERQGVTPDDLLDLTPELRREAEEILSRYAHGPLFTPPSERGTLILPGWAGGASWGGAAFDPERGLLFVASRTEAVVTALRRPDAARSDLDFVGAVMERVEGPRGLPLFAPPWARVTAYDMTRGEIAWVAPVGDGPRDHPAIRHLDLPPLGDRATSHLLATRSLLFVATGWPEEAGRRPRGGSEAMLRAFDKRTGALLAEIALPGNTSASPSTFLVDGRQLVVVAIGGAGAPPELVAFGVAGRASKVDLGSGRDGPVAP